MYGRSDQWSPVAIILLLRTTVKLAHFSSCLLAVVLWLLTLNWTTSAHPIRIRTLLSTEILWPQIHLHGHKSDRQTLCPSPNNNNGYDRSCTCFCGYALLMMAMLMMMMRCWYSTTYWIGASISSIRLEFTIIIRFRDLIGLAKWNCYGALFDQNVKEYTGGKWIDCLLRVLLANTIYIVSFYTYQIGHVYSSFCCCIVSQKLQEVYYLRPSSPWHQISWYSNKSATLLGADLIYNLINRFLIAWHFHGGKTPLIRIDYSLDWTTAAAAKKCISMWSIGFSFLAGSNFFSMHTQSIISSSP